MPDLTKDEILDKAADLSAEQLTRYIKLGIVSISELEDTMSVSSAVQREIKERILSDEEREWEKACRENSVSSYGAYLTAYPDGKYKSEALQRTENVRDADKLREDDDAFAEACRIGTEEALKAYLRRFEKGKHVLEANRRINDIYRGTDNLYRLKKLIDGKEDIINANGGLVVGTKADVLKLLSENFNVLGAGTVLKLIENNIITSGDLVDLGVPRNIITDYLFTYADDEDDEDEDEENKRAKFGSSQTPRVITGVNTEVYFWGIPASGKTCAIGAMLSSAKNEVAASVKMHNDSKAYGFMKMLAEHFFPNTACVLPKGTPVGSVHEMKLTMKDHSGEEHKMAILDLAGELFTCMFLSKAGTPLNNEQKKTLEELTVLLNNPTNQKIHFFVIEYGAENKKYKGLPQRSYLEAATEFIESEGIFTHHTDCICILVTKTDQIPADVTDKDAHIYQYLNKHFRSVYNRLKDISKTNEINGGAIDIQSFTMGDVYFKNFCVFDSASARQAVDLIMETSFSRKRVNKIARGLGKIFRN